MDLETFVITLSDKLKQQGYKKNRLTWQKENDGIISVFSIQKSIYGSDVWYYCFGICIKQLCRTKTISFSSCQIWERLDQKTGKHIWNASEIATLIEKWEKMYGNLPSLSMKAIEGNLPSWCSQDAMTYLTSVNIANLIHPIGKFE